MCGGQGAGGVWPGASGSGCWASGEITWGRCRAPGSQRQEQGRSPRGCGRPTAGLGTGRRSRTAAPAPTLPARPGQVSLSKAGEYWWSAVLEGEEQIDIEQINKERSMATVDEEEHAVLDRLTFDYRQKLQGKPQSHELVRQRGPEGGGGRPGPGQPVTARTQSSGGGAETRPSTQTRSQRVCPSSARAGDRAGAPGAGSPSSPFSSPGGAGGHTRLPGPRQQGGSRASARSLEAEEG